MPSSSPPPPPPPPTHKRSREDESPSTLTSHEEPSSSRPMISVERALPPPMEQRLREQSNVTVLRNQVFSSFFPLRFKLNREYYIHAVEFSVTDFPLKRREIMLRKMFRKLMDEGIRIGQYVFDGTTLVSDTKLEQREGNFEGKGDRRPEVRIMIRYTRTMQTDELSQSALQLLNNVYSNMMSRMQYERLGMSYINTSGRGESFLELRNARLYLGHKSTVTFAEAGSFIKLDLAQRILRDESALDVLLRNCRGNTIEYDNRMKGAVVMTPYCKNKMYRVIGVDMQQTPLSTLKRRDGSEITYAQYYEDTYKIRVQDMRQPLLRARVARRNQRSDEVRLIPELVMMTGIQDQEMRRAKELIRTPAQRVEMVAQQIAKIKSNKPLNEREMSPEQQRRLQDMMTTIFDQWELETDPYVVKEAFQLGFEKIIFGENIMKPRGGFNQSRGGRGGRQGPRRDNTYEGNEILLNEAASWQNDVKNFRMHTPVRVEDWLLVHFRNDTHAVQNWLGSSFKTATTGLGAHFNTPHVCVIEPHDQSAPNVIRALEKYGIERIKRQQIVVILGPNDKFFYGEVKRFLTSTLGVRSQYVTMRALDKLAVATNIVIQMQVKLGGVPWSVVIPFSKTIMIVGIDVTHSQRDRRNSVGAFCATTDNTYARYHTRCFFQTPRQEVADCLKGFMVSALQNFENNNGRYPAAVIVYRDGISDGEMEHALNTEVRTMVQGIHDLCGTSVPMSYIVVNKSAMGQKFFVKDERGVWANPPAGLVIDRGVTNANAYEFFLVSYSTTAGCINPVKYSILYNKVSLRANIIALLTFKLCHSYFNYSVAVRIPAPVFMAHKACEFIGQHLHIEAAANLSNSSYFL